MISKIKKSQISCFDNINKKREQLKFFRFKNKDTTPYIKIVSQKNSNERMCPKKSIWTLMKSI